MSAGKRASRIARYLEESEAIDPAAAKKAGAAIAAAWDAKEFWWAATAAPLATARRDSPAAAPIAELIPRLAREFGVFVHHTANWGRPAQGT